MSWVIDPWTPAGDWVARPMPCWSRRLQQCVSADVERAPLVAGEYAVKVKQDDEVLGQLGNAVQVLGIDAGDHGAGWLDRGGIDPQDFAHAVDDEADDLVADLDHDDARSPGVVGRRQAKTATQINHRNDFAAQIDDAFDKAGRMGHPGHFLQPDDLVHPRNLDPIQLRSELEDDELPLLTNGGHAGGWFLHC